MNEGFSLVSQALNHAKQRAMKGAKILVLGVAYKPDIADMRESAVLKLISLLSNSRGRRRRLPLSVRAVVHRALGGRCRSCSRPDAYHCVVIATTTARSTTSSSSMDASLVVDLRNATGAKGTACVASLSFDRRRGLGYAGPNLARNFAYPALRETFSRVIRVLMGADLFEGLPRVRRAGRRPDRDAGAALRARASRRSRQASMFPRREAARDARRGD